MIPKPQTQQHYFTQALFDRIYDIDKRPFHIHARDVLFMESMLQKGADINYPCSRYPYHRSSTVQELMELHREPEIAYIVLPMMVKYRGYRAFESVDFQCLKESEWNRECTVFVRETILRRVNLLLWLVYLRRSGISAEALYEPHLIRLVHSWHI